MGRDRFLEIIPRPVLRMKRRSASPPSPIGQSLAAFFVVLTVAATANAQPLRDDTTRATILFAGRAAGKKLFADGSAPHSYTLTRSRVSSTGLMIAHYERAGAIKIGDTALDSPSDAERARRERMKREG
jgi:hypothetical protein